MTRTDPPTTGDELTLLTGFLDFLRESVAMKADGLDAVGLGATHPPSTITLGGLLKHLAYVEDYWVGQILLGRPPATPWDDAPWDDDADWDWHSAVDDSPTEIRALWRRAVDTSRADFPSDLDTPGKTIRSSGDRFSGRWVLIHLIEEYGRHAGHADLIRESIDGVTGE